MVAGATGAASRQCRQNDGIARSTRCSAFCRVGRCVSRVLLSKATIGMLPPMLTSEELAVPNYLVAGAGTFDKTQGGRSLVRNMSRQHCSTHGNCLRTACRGSSVSEGDGVPLSTDISARLLQEIDNARHIGE
ncbi:hypothetical protein GWK47_003429 [Chionoecetes opilio]|uniref:Uncharacterized protein n=1 Tax=Chionoecetes opilio TaxID=41210 RepID=A0A8J4YW38_CHIOP|nr:hypothetical protein GWK47_003429 [Chionoecetes opilio]